MGAEQLITENFELWTTAIKAKSAQGRGNGKKLELYGLKKLRELILELAVRGKLVPQDQSDEPARVLLQRIADENKQLAKEKKIRRSISVRKISDDEKPFTAPLGWEWCRLGNVGHDWGQKTPDSDFTYIDVGAINNELGLIHEPVTVAADDAPSRARKLVKPGTVIYSTVRPYLLNIAVIEEEISPEPIASTAFAVLHPYTGLKPNYIYYFLRSPTFTTYVESCQSGIAYPAINDKQFFSGLIPVPPTSEQERIVAKVDELMAICDQLEQKTASTLDTHQLLVDTLLSSLIDAKDAGELGENWVRLNEHFDTLISTDYAVEQLKQTIQQLAVMGKLVSQDPSDEPASKLLESIAAEKLQLLKERKIKKQLPLPEITDEEKPFALPKGWEWCRLDVASLHSEAGWSPKCHGFAREENAWGVLKVSAVTWGEFNPQENKRLPDNLEPKPELEVRENDFLISRANTADLVARSVVVPPLTDGKLMMSDKIIRFIFSSKVSPKYFSLANNSRWSRDYYARVAGGTSSSMKNVSRRQIQMLVVALPPIEEQIRIVSKVDSLLILCDQLKSRLNDTQTTQLHLADAIVYEVIGDPVNVIGAAEANTQTMKFSTILALSHEKFELDAVIAPILFELGGSADAKDAWARTNLSLPEFYAQLKLEIDAKYILKPSPADFIKV